MLRGRVFTPHAFHAFCNCTHAPLTCPDTPQCLICTLLLHHLRCTYPHALYAPAASHALHAPMRPCTYVPMFPCTPCTSAGRHQPSVRPTGLCGRRGRPTTLVYFNRVRQGCSSRGGSRRSAGAGWGCDQMLACLSTSPSPAQPHLTFLLRKLGSR